mmetsp:Transcript_104395/g.292523  ORF Transcript_104395/g.292523 Transcript_104395/m.292523 type:complete len:503 (+) Transcript_104395:108-1616(+)
MARQEFSGAGGRRSPQGSELSSETDNEESMLIGTSGGQGEEHEAATGCRKVAQDMTGSECFKTCIAGVILMNTLCMAAQLDLKEFHYWNEVNIGFLATFVLEISLRLYAEGCKTYFCHPTERGWNIFDFAIVAAGVIDNLLVSLGPAGSASIGGFKPIMVARVLRMFRVLRILRVLRSFKKLQMLARGLVESVIVVFWIGVLVLVMIFICAILTTSVIGQNAESFPTPGDREAIKMYWGTVSNSMFTLFQFLTMDDWNSVDSMVVKEMPLMQFFFFPYIFFGAFVILSLLTGVMADHMNEVRAKEEQEELRARVSEMETAVKEVQRRDLDNSGFLDRTEFVELFDPQAEFTADLKEAGIHILQEEADDLFEWFDVDADEQITHTDLQQGLKSMLDGLTPLQLFKLSATVRCTEQLVYSCIETSEKGGRAPWSGGASKHSPVAERQLTVLSEKSAGLEEKFASFEAQMRSTMKAFGWKAEADASAQGSQEEASPVSPSSPASR